MSTSQPYGFWHSAVLTVQDWRRRRAVVNEIAALAPGEGDKVLSECGLSRADFQTAMRHTFASSILLPDAMKAKGIDQTAFERQQPEWNRDMRRTCMLCTQRSHCSAQLASAEFNNTYQDFCPNNVSLDALAAHAPKA